MIDETAKIRNPQRIHPPVQEQLRQLMQNISEATDLLRNQQEIMRQKGMNLPPGALDNLRKVRARADALTMQVSGARSELNQLRGLAETTALINSSLDTSDVLNQVIDKVIQLTGAERGYIMLKNEDTGDMEFRVARGMDREQLAESDFIISNTIVNRVASTGEPLLTHNALDDPTLAEQKSIVGYALRSILAVPLMVGNVVTGVVYCDNRIRAGLFKEHELKLLTAFANQAAVAIQNAKLFETARRRLDEVTEIRDLMDNVFTSIASGLITLNGDDVITAYNSAAERIFGVSAQDALGRPLTDLLPMLNENLAQKLQAARQNDAPNSVEFDIVIDEPERRYWKIKISPLLGTSGDREGVVMVLDDLTDVKQLEAQMHAASRYMPVALDNIRNLDATVGMAQEREITVLFADVRGFTSFSEKLEPEVLMQVINGYLGLSSEAIELFEGVVEKYIGDAVTGLFNTQLNEQDDHAIRAVRAALSMLYDIRDLHEQLDEEQRLFYGIGIHTGMAVVGSVGSSERREFSGIGDALDFSKLLQENAGRGEVLLSEATYERVKDYFECEPLEPRKTKGREDFTIMYQVKGLKRRQTGMLNG